MPKVIEKINLRRKGVYLFKQDNSPNWQVRIKIGKNKSIQSSTGTSSAEDAMLIAIEKYVDYKNKLASGEFGNSAVFTSIANEVILDIERDVKRNAKSSQYYISVIKRFTDLFFKKMLIVDVDKIVLDDYRRWRLNEYGQLSKSTINKHNIALGMIFKKAQDKNFAVKFRSELLVNDGERGTRRSEISYGNYIIISRYLEGRTLLSDDAKEIRKCEQLYNVIDFILFAGVRPGKELYSIRWKDIIVELVNGAPKLSVNISKAKTEKRSAVICFKFINSLHSIALSNPDRKGDDYVFSMFDGKKVTDEYYGRFFSEVLKTLESKLKFNGNGAVTLYSFRHSYISWRAYKKINLLSLAEQCGTSVDMIQKFYAHVSEEIQQINFGGIAHNEKDDKNYFTDVVTLTDKERERMKKYYLYLAENCKSRGFP